MQEIPVRTYLCIEIYLMILKSIESAFKSISYYFFKNELYRRNL